MEVRSFTFIVLTTCIFIISCDADDSEETNSSSGSTCPENEECSACIQSIGRAQYCSQKGQNLYVQDNPDCTEGCVCKESYLRNDNGTCIPETECGTDCGPDENLEDCPADCPGDYCPTKDGESTTCLRPDKDQCPPPVCKCRFFNRRAINGTCISTEDCPPFDCSARPNEVWTPCPPLCPTDSCGLARVTGICPFRIGIVLKCNPKCQCMEGYGRNSDGICVPFEECPDLCPVNEEYNSCTQAVCRQQNCSTINDPVKCPRIDPSFCKKGCVCKENYYRNSNGTCVSEDQCHDDPVPSCDDNEVLVDCPSDCPADYCPKSEDDNKSCSQPKPCPPATCKCRFNYRRAENGTCIPTTDCPPFNCSADCNEEYVPCPPLCPSDYGRLEDGTCVPFENCPDLCPVNEEYNSCTQAVCRQQNCSTINDPVGCPRIDPSFCKKGCVCKENYYRNSNGTCVSEDQCNDDPVPSCDDNEILVDCPSDCPADYCPKSEDDNKSCPQPNPCPPATCKCRFNYRRAENGTCIPTTDCPPFNCSDDYNEEYVPCPPLCPSDSCGLPRVEGKCPFRIGIILPCNPKCQCKDGYGRLEDGTCVPFENCPDLCPVNEEYNSCTQAVCRQQNCSTINDPVGCPRIDPSLCKKGCVCKENYYRNSNGTCVSEDQCNDDPVPSCDDNEILVDCPSDCPADYCPKSEDDNKSCPQPKPCPPATCKCRFNYRRAENGTCIPTTDCPPFNCSDDCNEEYVPCPPLCPSDSCGLPRVKGKCPFRILIRLLCNPKCQCKDGYGRLEDGTCVPFEKCPDLCPENEEYNSCTQAICRPQNCANISDIVACPMVEESSCIKGCVCKKDYYRNDTGACVTKEECEVPVCPNPYEEYRKSLIPNCPILGTCTSIVARIACDKPEVASCVCQSGYLRLNQTSPCIPICECPEMKSAPQCQTNGC